MDGTEWGLIIAIAALSHLGILAVRLIRAMWKGRAAPPTRAQAAIALVLLGASLLSLPRPREETALVAGVTMHASAATDAPTVEMSVHGNRVQIAGHESVSVDSTIWALVEDPRTGTLWLQGPATIGPDGWALDLVLGTGSPPSVPLTYSMSLAAVDSQTHQSWQAEALRGPVSLPTRPPVESWLARDRALTIGG